MTDRIAVRDELAGLLDEVRHCRYCQDLPLGPNPVLRVDSGARILVIGQAPGTRVHNTSIPWNDPSGDRLREWMGVDRATFYDPTRIAIMSMGFCYPGRGRSGDLPPRPECAPRWHHKLLEHMPAIELVLLIGQYAQRYYLREWELGRFTTLTETVRHWRDFSLPDRPRCFPLVHPSPRNRLWLQRNPWFEAEVVPALREQVAPLVTQSAARGR
ncbi:MAG: uracil-DNA glycosylase family protein [Porticoccaceae bacterium]|nr:uracil-DNA glycosylase family protein [Porticoccaceae bacterium]